jgi:D-glutamate cyclase
VLQLYAGQDISLNQLCSAKLLLSPAGDEIDRLVTIDIPARGVIHRLHEAASALTQAPLCYDAAETLKARVRKGDNVFIVCNFPIAPTFSQETDGPVGAGALARVLRLGLGAFPTVITVAGASKIVKSACGPMGLRVVDSNRLGEVESSTAVLAFPSDSDLASDRGSALLEKFRPAAILFLEAAGKNEKGVYHNMKGFDISERIAKTDILAEYSSSQGILTIGIGDGGNEIGMGNIVETVRRYVPNGCKCNCPCESGIASTTKVDTLVAAAISNWGAYGIEACLCGLLGKEELIHTGEMEKRSIRACVAEGAVDGASGKNINAVDGLSDEINGHFVELLRTIITEHSSE